MSVSACGQMGIPEANLLVIEKVSILTATGQVSIKRVLALPCWRFPSLQLCQIVHTVTLTDRPETSIKGRDQE